MPSITLIRRLYLVGVLSVVSLWLRRCAWTILSVAMGSLQISRKIQVLEVDQPYQLCYNATLPYFMTWCDPSESMYCSLKEPVYGCTDNVAQACTKLHFCNLPDSFLFTALFLLGLLTLLLLTGCLWCCFCCFCGRCCRQTCPCFASGRSEVFPTAVLPVPLGGALTPVGFGMYGTASDSMRSMGSRTKGNKKALMKPKTIAVSPFQTRNAFDNEHHMAPLDF